MGIVSILSSPNNISLSRKYPGHHLARSHAYIPWGLHRIGHPSSSTADIASLYRRYNSLPSVVSSYLRTVIRAHKIVYKMYDYAILPKSFFLSRGSIDTKTPSFEFTKRGLKNNQFHFLHLLYMTRVDRCSARRNKKKCKAIFFFFFPRIFVYSLSICSTCHLRIKGRKYDIKHGPIRYIEYNT